MAVSDVLQHIRRHMIEPLGYLPWGVLAGVVFLLLLGAWQRGARQKSGSMTGKRRWILFLCVVYITVLLNLTYFSREPGSRIGVTMEIFDTWGTTAREHAFFIENILLFIPFGILFPLAFPPLRKPQFCIMEGFFFSVFLELIQFVTGRGYCQLDDVVTNTLGALIGWGCYRLWFGRKQKDLYPHVIQSSGTSGIL